MLFVKDMDIGRRNVRMEMELVFRVENALNVGRKVYIIY